MPDSIQLIRRPLIDYVEAWRWQNRIAEAVRAGGPETLVLLQHPPVYTLGRNASRANLLVDPETLHARGADIVETDRGGDVTFHGPGQLVAYPVLDLRKRGLGAVDCVRALEAVVIETLARFGLRGERVDGRPGVWVDAEARAAGNGGGGRRSSDHSKVASIGVRIRGGVTTHGFALNVDNDLSWFDAIVPCGLKDARVTSMQELGSSAPIPDVEDAVVDAFGSVFGVSLLQEEATVGAVRERPLSMSRQLAGAHVG